jgi:hypothetical protein
MIPENRKIIDGLLWCRECGRGVDRGWPHDPDCSLRPDNEPDEETLKKIRFRVLDDRIRRWKGAR